MLCYLCHTQTNLFFTKNSFEIYLCPKCGLGETKLNQQYIKFVDSYYQKSYFDGGAQVVSYVDYERDKNLIQKNMHHLLQKLSEFKRDGKLLDIGCAFGYFLELAKSKGFDIYGIEPSNFAYNKAVHLLNSKNIYNCRLDNFKDRNNNYDVITLLDVFEHLDKPRDALIKINKLLTKDGILMLATGDRMSLLPNLIGRRWTFYIPPQHLFFFHKKIILELLNNTGFEVLSFFRVGKWLSLEYVLHLAETTGESIIAHKLLPFIKKLNLSSIPLYLPVFDNMVIIARKKS